MRVYKKREKISITKYDPKFRNELGHYQKDEWISISDIGLKYNDKIFTYDEYKKSEDLYVEAVFIILETYNCRQIKIEHLYKLAKKSNFVKYHCLDLYPYFTQLNNNEVIKDKKLIEAIIRLRLRELIVQVELTIDSKSRTQILFGFDYYMYIKTNKDITPLISKIESIGLFIY